MALLPSVPKYYNPGVFAYHDFKLFIKPSKPSIVYFTGCTITAARPHRRHQVQNLYHGPTVFPSSVIPTDPRYSGRQGTPLRRFEDLTL